MSKSDDLENNEEIRKEK